jgi:hypothetical protein
MPLTVSGPSNFDGRLDGVGGMAVDGDGSVLMTEPGLNRVVRMRLDAELPSGGNVVTEAGMADIMSILQSATLSAVAGSRRVGHIDGDPDRAEFNGPTGLAYDPATNAVYIADTGNSAVRVLQNNRVSTLDVVQLQRHSQPSGSISSSAGLVQPTSVAIGTVLGDLFVTEPHRETVTLLRVPRTYAVAHVEHGPSGPKSGTPIKQLLNWTFLAAVLVSGLVGLSLSRRTRTSLARRCFRDSNRNPPRPPKHWIQNQTY